ncbi:unnamed protein product [Linum trigynum]
MISKPPKIRIIHIFAPEIIKTDVANFRELVHRLTGKPTRLHPPPEPTPPLPPPMLEYDGGRNHDDEEEEEEEAGAAAGQYSCGFSGENYGNNDDDGSSLLFGSGNCCGGFGFEFLSAKESGTTGRTVKAEEENEMALWINSDRNSGDGGGEVGGGTCFGELDDGFIEELGEFPLLVEQNHHQQHRNYSHQRLNHHLHGFGSEATQFV